MLSTFASRLPVLGGAAAAACVSLRHALQQQTRGMLWSVEREKVRRPSRLIAPSSSNAGPRPPAAPLWSGLSAAAAAAAHASSPAAPGPARGRMGRDPCMRTACRTHLRPQLPPNPLTPRAAPHVQAGGRDHRRQGLVGALAARVAGRSRAWGACSAGPARRELRGLAPAHGVVRRRTRPLRSAPCAPAPAAPLRNQPLPPCKPPAQRSPRRSSPPRRPRRTPSPSRPSWRPRATAPC